MITLNAHYQSGNNVGAYVCIHTYMQTYEYICGYMSTHESKLSRLSMTTTMPQPANMQANEPAVAAITTVPCVLVCVCVCGVVDNRLKRATKVKFKISTKYKQLHFNGYKARERATSAGRTAACCSGSCCQNNPLKDNG